MTLIEFPQPFVMHHPRRCRECGDRIDVICLAGAEPPAREPHYRCATCRGSVPGAFPDRLRAAVDAEAQLELDPRSPSEAIETLDSENTEAATRTAPRKPFGEDSGEPIQAGGQTSSGGVRQHG